MKERDIKQGKMIGDVSISETESRYNGVEMLFNQCLKSGGYEEYVVKIKPSRG